MLSLVNLFQPVQVLQAVVEEHERIRLWFEERRAKPVDWEVCNMEPHCFLYHTNSREFLETSCVYDVQIGRASCRERG